MLRNPYKHIVTSLLLFVSLLFISTLISSKAEAACALPAPTTAAGYESLLKSANKDGRWYHGDYGQSIAIPNGRVLWLFSDTTSGSLGPNGELNWGDHMIHNSALVTEGGCSTVLTGPNTAQGKATDWIPIGARDIPNLDDYYWLNNPFIDGQYLRIFLLHMYNDANGFHTIGSDIATFNSSGTLLSVLPTPGSNNGEMGIWWGAGVVKSGNYTYIFGAQNRREYLVFGHYYYLARVPNGQVTIPTSWRYWNGSSWVTNQANAQYVMSGNGGVGSSATVYPKSSGGYILVGKKEDAFGEDLVAYTAPALTGPWTEQQPHLVSPIPNVDESAGEVTYLGLAHPHISLASGNLLVSWNFNSYSPSFLGDPRYGVYFAEAVKP